MSLWFGFMCLLLNGILKNVLNALSVSASSSTSISVGSSSNATAASSSSAITSTTSNTTQSTNTKTNASGKQQQLARPKKQDSTGLPKTEIVTRVYAACSMVAPEFSATTDEVYELVDPETAYNYSIDSSTDLVEVIRLIASRAREVCNALDQLAKEANVDRGWLGGTKHLNWFNVYEMAVNRKVQLIVVMREALAWLLQKENEESKQKKQEKRHERMDKRDLQQQPTSAFEKELGRIKGFKGIPDGRSNRKKDVENQQNSKKEELLAKARGIKK